ncbi:hypothetical protein QJS10_CPB19g01418 [Acorus calamus]|uniref:Reverse transcriptase zinc-binding domain-containing protein n=1 Tax=Acorus calamus TaxID=4465 RepID=A0AAV9CJH9_ACOCL|nr:hypothetical protein QJS10_CPB19g01418 [Acorus calamus]
METHSQGQSSGTKAGSSLPTEQTTDGKDENFTQVGAKRPRKKDYLSRQLLNQKNGKEKACIKIDLRKEFDSVRWGASLNKSSMISFTAWQAMHHKLPTLDRQQRRGMVQHISCSLCKRGQESHDHLFFACSFSCYIWKAIATKLDLRRPPSSPISQWQQWLDNLHLQEGKLKLMQAFLATCIMLIWKERCMRIYQGKERHKNLILKDVFELTQVKLSSLTLKTADPNFSQHFLGELGLQMILLQPYSQGVTSV